MPFILAIVGAGVIVGDIPGAWLADRSSMGTIGGMTAFNVAVLVVFAPTAALPCVCVFFIGVAPAPRVQTRLIDVASHAQALAAVSMHSAFIIAGAARA